MRIFCLFLSLATTGLFTGGCVTHIRPFKEKVRKYKPDRYAPSVNRAAEGSLWDESTDTLFTHRRSLRIGDLVTVLILESANATRGAETELSRSSNTSLGVNAFAGAMKALSAAYPAIDPSKLVEAAFKNDFSGKGKTTRSGKLEATLTTRIRQVLPNGDLYIEGTKVVMINDEESHLYLSGVVRTSDLQADNTVYSSLVADMQVEYSGRGPVADKQKPGWFTRLLDMISPF
ncbi:MAG: flagellar basal body L-ring protein FlgH [Pseudomonadota bacterium]